MICGSSIGKSSAVNVSENEEQQSSSSIDDISKRAQEVVDKINESRTSDQKVMDSFQEKLGEKVMELCQHMKESMFRVYEENNEEMQLKLQELSQVLDSCSKLNQELLEATQALSGLREALSINEV
ncbi:synaptonemal complex central element protein 2 [Salarias fasciatus]|uniref:synaptonemal complex central element protein 2 n=1 Tax=Salarias fasciatus TaxID=181472 RepID=UPI001176F769|nr:synaptonemal complex central element protein 2-like [Salarias fasciatus]